MKVLCVLDIIGDAKAYQHRCPAVIEGAWYYEDLSLKRIYELCDCGGVTQKLFKPQFSDL